MAEVRLNLLLSRKFEAFLFFNLDFALGKFLCPEKFWNG